MNVPVSMRQMGRMMAAVLTAAVLSGAPAISPAAEKLEIYHFKTPQGLVLDTSRVAVLGERSAKLAAIDSSGLAKAKSESLAIKDWTLVEISGAAESAVRDQAAKLSSAGGDVFASPVFFDNYGGPLIATPFVLVQFADNLTVDEARAALAAAGFDAAAEPHWAGMKNAFRARAVKTKLADGFAVLGAANTLARDTNVVFAEPDMIFTGRSALTPNDTGYTNCWGLNNTGQTGGTNDADMDAPEAWDITTGSSSIITVVIDTGVEQSHPDINQMTGQDFTSDGNSLTGGPVNTCDNHGTPVAGCVSGTINNSLGSVGVAPATLSASARCFISGTPTCDGSWSSVGSWTVDALAWAETISARVTNNSNGYGFTSSAIETKYSDTRNNGIVHFASMGNENVSTGSYPASLTTVVGVVALDHNGARASFSNYGASSGISAPGQTIYAADRTGSAGYVGGDYVNVNGTSFASPYTAGCAALVLSAAPSLTAPQVETALYDSAVDLGTAGWDTTFGWGFVNVHAALLEVNASVRDWTVY